MAKVLKTKMKTRVGSNTNLNLRKKKRVSGNGSLNLISGNI